MRQRSRNQVDRATYIRLKRNLQTALKKAENATFEQFITSLSPDDTYLWKATKCFKRPQVSIPSIRKSDGSWAKSDTEKATAFGDHHCKLAVPYNKNKKNIKMHNFQSSVNFPSLRIIKQLAWMSLERHNIWLCTCCYY